MWRTSRPSDVPAAVRARALQMILDGSGALLAAADPKISTGRLIANFVGDLGGNAGCQHRRSRLQDQRRQRRPRQRHDGLCLRRRAASSRRRAAPDRRHDAGLAGDLGDDRRLGRRFRRRGRPGLRDRVPAVDGPRTGRAIQSRLPSLSGLRLLRRHRRGGVPARTSTKARSPRRSASPAARPRA